MLIQVTQEDIDRGVRRSESGCPIALAIKRLVMPDIEICVTSADICVDEWEYVAPGDVYEFVEGFDEGNSVQPFTFDLDIPPDVLAESAR